MLTCDVSLLGDVAYVAVVMVAPPPGRLYNAALVGNLNTAYSHTHHTVACHFLRLKIDNEFVMV